jgi:mono/diheme cytochrome c family protein
MNKLSVLCLLLASLLAGCSLIPSGEATAVPSPQATGMAAGSGMGSGSSMSARHHAPIPEPYKSLSAPQAAEGALERGGETYTQHCTSCHGDGGMGDGPAGQVLDPVAAPVARTSGKMSDGYLFWRVTEGGTVFSSSMPAWKETLTEQQIWEVLAYLRALGSGQVTPQASNGGEALQPGLEAQQQAEILAKAVEQSVISQEEADNFALVHIPLEERIAQITPAPGETMDARQAAIFEALVAEGVLTQAQVDLFNQAHQKLMDAGLEP